MANKNIGDIILGIVAETKGFDSANKELEKVKQNLDKTAMTMAKFSAVITGALALSAKTTLDYTEQIDKMNKQTGVSTDTLQKLGYAASQEGVNMQDLGNSLKYLMQSLSQAKNGNETAINSFSALGINAQDSAFQMLSLEDKIKLISDSMKGLTDDSERTALVMELFGKSGYSIVPFLLEGSKEMGRLGDEAVKIGKVLDANLISKGEQVGDEVDRAKASFDALVLKIGSELLPVISDLSNKFTDFVSKLDSAKPLVDALSAVLLPMLITAGSAKMISGIISLSQAINNMGGITAGVTSSMGAMSISLGLAAKGMYDLGQMIKYGAEAWTEYNKAKEYNKSLEESDTDRASVLKQIVDLADKEHQILTNPDAINAMTDKEKAAAKSLWNLLNESRALQDNLKLDALQVIHYMKISDLIGDISVKTEDIAKTKSSIYSVDTAMLNLQDLLNKKVKETGESWTEIKDFSKDYQMAEYGTLKIQQQTVSNTDLWVTGLHSVDSAMQSILDKSMSTGDKIQEIVANLLPALGFIIGTAINPVAGGAIGSGLGAIGSTVVRSFEGGNISQPININVSSPVFSDTEAVEMTFRRAVRKGITLSNAGAINV